MFPLLYLAPHQKEGMKALAENLERLQALIENNQVEEVFGALKPLVKYTEYSTTVSLLLSDFNEIRHEALNKAITTEEERVRLIQIKKSLLQLLRHIHKAAEDMIEEDNGEAIQATLARNEQEFQRLLEEKVAHRYTHLEKISSGDSAIIYKAEKVDKVTNSPQKVAIKVIKPLSIIDEENLENIREDLSKAKQLSGLDGIINIIDEGLDAPPRYIVTEYVDGMRLSECLEKGWPYQPKEVREMLSTMGRALYQGHQDGLVHNNLWPSNILIDKKKGPRISPFQVIRASYYKRSFERLRLFLMYWSPEQVNTDTATPLSDQYSFALIAVELFTGQPFFRGDTVMDILRRRLNFEEDPDMLRRELSDTPCPPEFARALLRMLSHEPGERFLDMEEVLEEVQKLPSGSHPEEKHPEYQLLKKLRNSYSRVRRIEGFYKAFYDFFLDKSPNARDIFDRAYTARMARENHTEEELWKYQHQMLDLAMERLLQFPSVSTAMGKSLQRLVKQHAAVGVQAEDYALFLDCLKEAIYTFDEDNWAGPEELDQAWEVAVRNALEAMQRG
ncbi:MAG: protein kinase [Phaeodactylibacter sp.]|nr:protein kinase [Phaeodactylibacter sp.]MCB9266738.1 protein kinase [Lewinellaceae bacterium]MCB9286608.1 protein kinase [Lewinellaceae bacterium]